LLIHRSVRHLGPPHHAFDRRIRGRR